jgi:hypothetical protein
MDTENQIRPALFVALFALQTLLNWFYVIWVKAQPIINNAWFVVLPLIGFFYFSFAFIACIWMYYRKRIGINLAYCVLMFGASIDILSYSLIFQHGGPVAIAMLPLVVMNLCVVFYIAYHQKYFQNN